MGEELRCEYCGKTGFKTPQALAGHIGFKHPEEVGAREAGEKGTPKTEAREVPIVEDDFTTAELVRGKRMDIMRKASYGIWDKSALTWLSASRTLLPSGHNLPQSSIKKSQGIYFIYARNFIKRRVKNL